VQLSDPQRSLVVRIVNVFETGRPEGDYGAVSIYDDGPGRVPQVTYGRSQTTEYGQLRELLETYVASGGRLSAEMRPYLDRLGTGVLHKNRRFKELLAEAGTDPVMVRTQDSFFDEKYFRPAWAFAAENGFALPLSFLVIYDSCIHSGRVPSFLRARFPEVPPARGGAETAWTRAYVDAREAWLAGHANPILQRTVYRTACFTAQMDAGNWDLSQVPVAANGVPVYPA
jgi:chitosanase